MEEQSGKIAVIGGTGRAGKYLVNQFLEAGYEVRALVRNPKKVSITHTKLELVQGDARNTDSIRFLLNGCGFVVSALGQMKGEEPIFSTATSNVLKAMEEYRINQYMVISGSGGRMRLEIKKNLKSKLITWLMKWMHPGIMADRQKELNTLMGSNVQWTLLRLSLIQEGPSAGEVKISLQHSPGKKLALQI
ncbi:NmrA-like family protein [compost metagenome]